MTVGLPSSDHIVSQVICQHPLLYIRTVPRQVYCILTKQGLHAGSSNVKIRRRPCISRQIYDSDKKIRLIQIFGGGQYQCWNVSELTDG